MPIPGYITAGVVPAPRRREAVAILTKEARRAEAIPTQHLREVRRAAVRIPLQAEVQAQAQAVLHLLALLQPDHPAEVLRAVPIAAEAADEAAVEDVVKQ